MNAGINRQQAWELLTKYNKDTFHLQHALTVEGVMKWFAAGCSRKVIEEGAALLGWELDTLIEKTLTAMKSCEADVATALA
jgi:Predicted hydrolase (HD superfamily)